MMKKYILILIILLTQLTLVKAQPSPGNDDKQQRIEALYVAFVTRQLNLTAEEAQQFWPIHTKFLNEIRTVKPNMPELDKQQMVLDIKKRYQSDFSKVLGNKRTEEFFKINAEFKKRLLEKIRKQKGNAKIRRGM